MNVATLLERSADAQGETLAWKYGDARATYGEFRETVRRLAQSWHERGLRPGDRVVLYLPNQPGFVEALFGAFWAGLVAVPVNWHLHPRELGHIIDDSAASCVVVSEDTIDAARGCAGSFEILLVDQSAQLHPTSQGAGDFGKPAEAEPEDPAWLFYTSGTTGRPKGAELSHRSLMAMLLNYYADVDPVPAGSIFAHAAPLSHGSGLYLLPAVGHGATNVISDSQRFDAAAFAKLLQRERATHLAFLAPTMLQRLSEYLTSSGQTLDALRSVVVGGAPLYANDLREAERAIGHIVTQIYGQGESPMTITCAKPEDPSESADGHNEEGAPSCGRPFTGVDVRVVDSELNELPAGVTGEICVKGDVVMTGYWRNAAATEAALRSGWLLTGDVGHFDDRGQLYLTDRARDVVITGGSNVYPREVEEVLQSHPDVRDVSVIGVPDKDWGESLCAFVVPEPGKTLKPETLIDHAKEHLASFKKPRHVLFVESLPRNATGKVVKNELRQSWDADEYLFTD